jgi:hypothetical protein
MDEGMKYIEFDVTNACNLKCNNCTRRCDVAPRNDFIDLPSFFRFLDDAAFHPFRRIVIMGGEPTLHPEIDKICREIKQLCTHKYNCTPIIVTNCLDPKSVEFVDGLTGFDVRKEPKNKVKKGGGARPQDFWTMNVAPIDFPEFQKVDFSKGCRQAKRCGYQRSVYGKYYACAMAGPIDEIFDLGMGVTDLKDVEHMKAFQFSALCRFCGRLRVEYDLGWALFKYDWQKEVFKKNCELWPLKSGKKYISPSWEVALRRKYGREST